MNTWTNDHHILHELTCVNTPSQKGKAEVSGKKLSKLASAMQLTSHTGDEVKTALLKYAFYIENSLASPKLSELVGYTMSQYYEMYGKPASFANCFPFGSAAHILLDKQHHPNWKLRLQTVPAIYVGHANWYNKKAFLVYDQVNNKYIATVNLKVDPNFFPCHPAGQQLICSWDMNVFEGNFGSSEIISDTFPDPDYLPESHINEPITIGEQLPTVTPNMLDVSIYEQDIEVIFTQSYTTDDSQQTVSVPPIDSGVPLASDLQPAVHTSPQRLLIVTPDGTFMCPEHTVYFLESGAPGEEPLVSLTASTIPLTYAKMM